MDDASHAADEFGFPISAIQRLQRAQGIAPVQGEYGLSAGTNGRPLENAAEPGMGFTLAEYDEAFCELQIVNLLRRN